MFNLFAGLATMVATSVPAAADLPQSEVAPEVSSEAGGPLATATELRRGRRVFLMPRTCGDSERVDVLVHFHGAPKTLVPVMRRSSLNAVVVVVNLGQYSGPYETAFERDGSYSRFISSIGEQVAQSCAGARIGRVAISAWSGGYGAPYRILAHAGNAEQIDAVLLADGLHAGFAHKPSRKVSPRGLAPFSGFVAKAAAGEKLFVVTHASIRPPSYAGVGESVDVLLEQNDVKREHVDTAGPRSSMRQTSRAQKGALHVSGFAGNDTDAHCDQLYALDSTLLVHLERRWATR